MESKDTYLESILKQPCLSFDPGLDVKQNQMTWPDIKITFSQKKVNVNSCPFLFIYMYKKVHNNMQISQIYYIKYAVTKLSKYMQYSRSVIFKLYLLTFCTNPPVSSYLESDWKKLALGSLCWVPFYEEVSAELIKV